MSIRTRILLLVGFPVGIMLVTTALLTWSERVGQQSQATVQAVEQVTDKAALLEDASGQVQLAALQFIRKSSVGAAELVQDKLKDFRSKADGLVSDPGVRDRPELGTRIQESVGAVAAAAAKLLAAEQKLGYTQDEGSQGAMRSAVRKLETQLAELAVARNDSDILRAQVLMLTLRRHEKDFLLRGDPRYVADLAKTAAELSAHLKATSMSDPGGALAGNLSSYVSSFNEHARNVAQRDQDLAGLDAALRAAVKETTDLHAVFQAASGEAAAAEAARRHLADLVNELALVVASLITAGIGVVVAIRLARRIRNASETLDALASGNLSHAIEGTTDPDEIGNMARSAAFFRDSLVRMRELEEQERAAAVERTARTESMIRVVNEVGLVVAAAADGDFSARVAVSSDDEQIRNLVSGINAINSVVDKATEEFTQTLGRVAQGDLTQPVLTEYRGRFADLKNAVNDTIARLAETVATIQTAAQQVAGSAREINAGADDLSRRTEQQASSLEETAATTEELAASVKASAQSSRQAVHLADEAMNVAQAGGSIVSDAVEAMERIEQASRKISDITSVIDDIAFQTNLLALNAAVEAARAGEAGKGFAVVAAEVRTLAQRSSESAKDITGLISSSGQEVLQGVQLVRSAGDALKKIVEASGKVTATVSEISAAAAEQANGIDEMSQAVAHMDEMTQQNAALAEESAASAGAMSEQIERLNDLVATFRIRGSQASQASRPARSRPAAAA